MIKDSIWELKSDLAVAHRIIAFENMHEGTWTHLSVMVPGEDKLMLVSPGSRHFSHISADDILTMNAEGEVVGSNGRPNQAAWCLHYPIHMVRTDAKCIIHLHSTHACALLMQRDVTLDEAASQPAATLYKKIAYYDLYESALRKPEEGYQMAEILGQCWILAHRNHGYIVVGDTIAIALERAYNFERACQLQLLAQASGHKLNRIPDHMIAEIFREENLYVGGYFEGMKRLFEDS